MDNQFHKTREIFKELQNTLDANSDNISLKRYFTEYILIILYGELEDKLLHIIKQFLESHSNEALSSFLVKNLKTIFNRTNKKDLQKTLKMFDKGSHFNSYLTTEEITIYHNAILNRDKVAHSNDAITLSWTEVEKSIKVTEKIINTFERDLSEVVIDRVD